MVSTKECDRGQIFHGPCRLLQEIHWRILKDRTPNHFLERKGIKFQWTSDCERSFQHLKQLLTSAPILTIADPNEHFIVCTDACNEGLGGVLSQNVFVICYESRKLKEYERNYSTHDWSWQP
jgi:hypothetical protein